MVAPTALDAELDVERRKIKIVIRCEVFFFCTSDDLNRGYYHILKCSQRNDIMHQLIYWPFKNANLVFLSLRLVTAED